MKNLKAFRKNLDSLSGAKVPNELITFTEETVLPFFELDYLGIFSLNNSETTYNCIANLRALNYIPAPLAVTDFDLNNPIVKNFLDSKKYVLLKEVNRSLAIALTEERRLFLVSLAKELNRLNAEVCVPGFIGNKLSLILLLGQKASKEEFTAEELELFSLLAKKLAETIYNFNLLKKNAEDFVQSIREVNQRLEIKDLYTRGHSQRVGEFAVIIGKKLQTELNKIPYGDIILYYAAEFHDVGKINTPDSILKKESFLNEAEYAKIKEHPVESVKILKPMKEWFGQTLLDAVLYHHENYDGTGYPYGKKGNEVNILARIIRVADSFDAMVTDRPYRKALLQHQALSELRKGRGKQFDPKVIDVFLEAYREGLFKEIFSQIAGLSKNTS